MQLIRVCAAIGAIVMLPGAAWTQPTPEYIGYANPIGASPPCDIAPQTATDPGSRPVFPIFDVPVNGTLDLHLCFLVWPQQPTGTGLSTCDDGDGTESCAEQAEYVTNGGIEMQSFQPVQPDEGQSFPAYETRLSSPLSLMIMGGHPVDGRLGTPSEGVHLGQVSLKGIAPGGYFELSSGAYVAANGARMAIPNIVLATTANNCGNNVVDTGEDCDDGNTTWGDGCSPTCKVEQQLGLEGTAGSIGSVSLELDGVPVSVDLATVPGAPAATVILALVTQVNAQTALNASAAQADDFSNETPDDGQLLATDGMMTAAASVDDALGTLAITVPEPGAIPLLVAGAAFLVAVGRRRIRR